MNDAQRLKSRTPLAISTKYTPEVNELYGSLLAECKALAAIGYNWNKMTGWSIHYSKETCLVVFDRFRNEHFSVHDYDEYELDTCHDFTVPYVPHVALVDWTEPCMFKCDAQEVQLLNSHMLTDAVETKARQLYSKVVGLCNTDAIDGQYWHRLNLSYLMYAELDSGMHPTIQAPVVQRLLALLNEQGFKTEERVRGNTNFIDINWLLPNENST